MLVSGITILLAGCGIEGAQALHESQTEAEKNDISNYDDYMSSITKQIDIVNASLELDTLTQTDMNMKAQELYELWDDALNYLWGELKDSLPTEEFSKLLDEQRCVNGLSHKNNRHCI